MMSKGNRRGVVGLLAMVLAGSGAAQAVNLANDGTGQVLIYPYYTVNGGFQTLLSVVNTTQSVKALKVFIRESLNGRATLSFNIYLSPLDVWTAAIFDYDVDGLLDDAAAIITSDESCTVPDIINRFPNGVTFRTFKFEGTNGDGGPTDLLRTREGYIEIIEMGELDNSTEGSANAATLLVGEPEDCLQLNDAWRTLVDGITPAPGAYWQADATTDLLPPTGGLRGAVSLVDVADGQMVSYDAIAIDGFWQPNTLAIHTPPGADGPNLGQSTFDSDQDGRINSVVLDEGQVVMSDWAYPVDAVSAVLTQEILQNDYVFEESLDADTSWLMLLPTKPFYTDPALSPDFLASAPPIAPFEKAINFPAGNVEAVPVALYQLRDYYRAVGPPPTICTPFICGDARLVLDSPLPFVSNTLAFVNGNVFEPDQPFGHYPTVTESLYSVGLEWPGWESGWAFFNFWADDTGEELGPVRHQIDGAEMINGVQREEDGDLYRGLPVLGFSLTVLRNGTLLDEEGERILSNYAGISRHASRLGIEDRP